MGRVLLVSIWTATAFHDVHAQVLAGGMSQGFCELDPDGQVQALADLRTDLFVLDCLGAGRRQAHAQFFEPGESIDK